MAPPPRKQKQAWKAQRSLPPLSAILPVIIIIGGAFLGAGWWWWVNSPNYAIAQLVAAQRTRNADAFAERVDLDAVSAQITSIGEARLDDVLDDLVGRAGGKGAGIRELTGRAKEQLLSGIRLYIQDQMLLRVEEGTFTWGLLSRLEQGRIDDLKGWLDDGKAPEFVRVGDIRQSGKTARAVLWHRDGRDEFPVTLILARAERWQVVAVEQE